MINGLIERIALAIALKVVDELFERMPEPLDLIIKILPDIAERLTDEVLERLPFPFKR